MPLYRQGLSFPLAQMPRPNGVSRSITGDCGVEQGGIAAGFFQTENAYHCVLGFSPRSETGSMELLLERANPLPVKILAKNTERGRNRAPGLAWSDSVGQQEQASAVMLACGCTCVCTSCASTQRLTWHRNMCYASVRVFVFGCGARAREYGPKNSMWMCGPALPSILASTSLFSKPT